MIIKSVKRSKIVSNALYHVIITAFSFAMIYPLLWMIGSSFKFNEEIFVNVRRILPTKWTITNYTTGWAGFGGNSFALFFKNSFFVTILVTIGTVLSSSFIAFGFARIRFRGRSFWFVMMIITMLLPGQVMIIPRYVMFNNMGWVGTFLPLIIPPFFGGAFNIFLIMQFIRGIPRDMDESAKIDGARQIRIFVQIVLPISLPAIATIGLFYTFAYWNDWMMAKYYLNSNAQDLFPLQYVLISLESNIDFLTRNQQFMGPGEASNIPSETIRMAMVMVGVIPIACSYPFFQKYFISGLTIGAVKG